MKATANSQANDSAVTWPAQKPIDGFKRQYAHQWTGNELAQVTPRRKHQGPPAGQGERRAVMYKGRTDQLHQPAGQPAQVAPAAPGAHQAPAGQVATQAAPYLADVLAGLLVRALDGFGPALAQALAGAALERVKEPAGGFSGPVDPMGDRWPTPAEYAEVMRQPAPAQDADQDADQAPAQPRAKRTRKTQDADQAPAGQDAGQVALPAPGRDMADYGRRKDDRPKLDEKQRRQLRKEFAELDVYLNSEEADDLDETKIEWGDYSRKYIRIFMNCVHKGWSARRSHNFASKETYGKDAVIV
jgi:hypothetical protein